MYNHKNGVVLRKIKREDTRLLFELKNESWFGTHCTAIINEDDQDKWFSRISESSRDLIMIASVKDERVGLYKINNIDWVSRRYDSAHDVFFSYRGLGYGKKVLEAGVDFGFEILNMNRLDSDVLENNYASMSNAIYVGFVKEGVRRKAIFKSGQWLDSIVIGILQEDWKILPRVLTYGGCCNLSYTPTGKIN